MNAFFPATTAMLSLFLVIATSCGPSETSSSNAKPSKNSGKKLSRPPRAPFPVEIQQAELRPTGFVIEGTGSLLAMDEVKISARVSGVIDKIQFMEGSHVEKGALLAEIEPERFKIEVASAKAAFEKAAAAASEAKQAYSRREKLVKSSPGLLSAEDVEKYASQYRTAKAEESLAKAALSLAELNLKDAFVRAPVSGVIETKSIGTGTYVKPGDTLATIVVREPLLLETFVSTSEAAKLSTNMPMAFVSEAAGKKSAQIRHVGQSAALGSRRVRVLAEVEGVGPALRPGDFVRVEIPLAASDSKNVPVIPLLAVRPSERGFLAYVATDGVVQERLLSLGARSSDGFVEVLSGIDADEWVVSRGAGALFDGANVKTMNVPKQDNSPSSPKAKTKHQDDEKQVSGNDS